VSLGDGYPARILGSSAYVALPVHPPPNPSVQSPAWLDCAVEFAGSPHRRRLDVATGLLPFEPQGYGLAVPTLCYVKQILLVQHRDPDPQTHCLVRGWVEDKAGELNIRPGKGEALVAYQMENVEKKQGS
jgi:hypothetical protein